MSVFIQIPAYRDWELTKTVADAIDKSSGKYPLHFGIHNCLLFAGETERPKPERSSVRVSYHESIAPQNIGLQTARYIANEFYDGEDYYLQIDSHMRFARGWDSTLIETIDRYKKLGIDKPLISQYPPHYGYDDHGNEMPRDDHNFSNARISFREKPEQFAETLIPSQTAVHVEPLCGYVASVSGGFIFTLGEFASIKPNKKIAFWGEEPLIAARAFTHGFDLVMPLAPNVWHLYHSNQPFHKTRRHHVWTDFPALWGELDAASKAEYLSIFTDRRIGEGALGSARTLREFEEFSGLNFADRTIKS
jgi:hypothetical protein